MFSNNLIIVEVVLYIYVIGINISVSDTFINFDLLNDDK